MKSMRRRVRRLAKFVLVLGVIWVIFALVMGTTVYFYGAIDRAQPADVIIVLGAGLRSDGSPDRALTRRSRLAASLWREGMAPIIICTGGVSERVARPEAEGCRDVLIEEGIDPEAILVEDRSRSTEENALNSHAIMQQHGWQTAVLVTDGFHMLRAAWIFTNEGITVYNSPVSSVGVSWLPVYIAREVVALHWQFIKQVLGIHNTYVQGL
ncbi:MAG: YdcF family protein [Anaerolineae bacterium]